MHRSPVLSLIAGLLACSPAPAPEPANKPPAPPVSAPPAPAVAPTPPAVDPSWSRVTYQEHLPGVSFVRASHDFGDRITLPGSPVSEAMRDGPAIVVAPTGIFFDGKPVARITNGDIVAEDRDPVNEYLLPQLLAPLQLALAASADAATARGELPPGLVTLFADRATPYSVLIPIVLTSGRARGADYQIAVTPTGAPAQLGSDMLHFSPPKFSVEGIDVDPARLERLQLVMMVSRTDVRIGKRFPLTPDRSAWLERVPLADDRAPAMRRISELAAITIKEDKWGPNEFPVVLVGAERDVPLDLLVATFAAAAGPDCNMDDFYARRPNRCLFIDRVLHAGSPAPPELVDK